METLLATPGVFILILGVILLIISVVGGELEIKEFKIPKLRKSGRIIISVTGLFLVGTGCLLSAGGLYLTYVTKIANATKEAPQTAPQRIEIQIDTGKVNQELPSVPGIANDDRNSIVNLIVDADKAEINAVYYKDKSYLSPDYTGDALTTMESEVDNALNSSNIILYVYSQDKSYYMNMRQLDTNTYSIDACEYWTTSYYDATSGALVTSDPEQLDPQTITIVNQDGQFSLSAITTYSSNVFCTR